MASELYAKNSKMKPTLFILAAGMGKRLGALTKDNTKCMIKVNGVTLIDRLLIQLSSFSPEGKYSIYDFRPMRY